MPTQQYVLSFKTIGYAFQRVYRQGNVAIYAQTRSGVQEPIAWEVVVLEERKAKPAIGIEHDYESYPTSEEWGQRGWTCMTLAEARTKAQGLA